MKKITPILSAILLSLSCLHTANAQGFKDKFFTATGFTVGLDVAQLPAYNYLTNAEYINNELTGTYTAIKPISVSYFTYAVKFRYNLVDFSDDASLSLHVQPALGLSFSYSDDISGVSNIGSFSLPIMVGFNTGNISTYKTSKNKGFGIALGVEYFNGGLIKSGANEDKVSYTDNATNQIVYVENVKQSTGKLLAPSMEVCYRYWTKSNKAREISFLASFGGKGDLETNSTFQQIEQTGAAKGTFHFRIMWSKYLNY